jgi:hypothetical protein
MSETDTAQCVGLNHALLAIAFPEFRFTLELRPGDQLRWVAVRKDARMPGVHTVVTGDLDELLKVIGPLYRWKVLPYVSAALGAFPAPVHDDPAAVHGLQPRTPRLAAADLVAVVQESTPQRRDLMNLADLLDGTPYAECRCLKDDTVHYHADRLMVLAVLYVEQWRMRLLKLLSPRMVTWSASGADDPDWAKLTVKDGD